MWRWTVLLPVVMLAGGCGDDPSSSGADPQLAVVSPPGGSIGVNVSTVITIGFTHPMLAGMEQYVAVHEGTATGPLVDGSWGWSQDRTRLTFTPAEPLKAKTQYTIHVGGGMRDRDHHAVGLGRYGHQMGGQWATGPGMPGGGMMGGGWRHENGSYGMTFTFTTA
jgi:hypothetical protein